MTAKAETVVGCYASLGPTTQLKTVPKGHTWTKDASLRATVGRYNDCTTTLTFRTPTSMSITVVGGALRSRDHIARSNLTHSDGRSESHTISTMFRPTSAPVAGHVRIRIDGSTWKQSSADLASAWARVSIGSTRIAWQAPSAPVERLVPVTLPVAGLAVIVESLGMSTSNQGPATFRVETDVEFFPGSCILTPYGQSCAAMSSWFATARKLRMSVTSTAVNGLGVTLVGLDRRNVPLPAPFTGCRVLVEPLFVLSPFPIDANGRATHDLDLPNGSGKMLLQDVLMYPKRGATWLATTNGLEIECRR